jgi:hypothetical protein
MRSLMVVWLHRNMSICFNVNFNVNFKIVFLDNSLVHQLVNKKTLIISRCTVCMWKLSTSLGFLRLYLSTSNFFAAHLCEQSFVSCTYKVGSLFVCATLSVRQLKHEGMQTCHTGNCKHYVKRRENTWVNERAKYLKCDTGLSEGGKQQNMKNCCMFIFGTSHN